MRSYGVSILIMALAAAMPAGAALAQTADPPDGADADALTRPPYGSLARQLALKLQLQMAGGASLAASLDHNRQEWRMLSADQREQYRRNVLAFLDKAAADQESLLRNYSALQSLPKDKQEAYRRRAEWLKVVVASFSPQEREDLRQMTPTERARQLMARRDELIRQGTLAPDGAPTSMPATLPASVPARQ